MRKLTKHLKHHFIPDEGNEYAPHFLREASVASLLSLALLLFIASTLYGTIALKTDFLASIYPAVLVDLTNDARASANDAPLSVNEKLQTAAALKAEDMATKGYFAHVSPEGLNPWHWFDLAGYSYVYAGENLAVNFTESQDVQNGWMNSPTHRANIVSPHFTEIGIQTAQGMYEGRLTTFVVQDFGSPAAPVIENTEIATSSPAQASSTPQKSVAETKSASSTAVLAAALPEVHAASTEKAPLLSTLVSDPTFIAVENQTALAAAPGSQDPSTGNAVMYAPWYGKILFFLPQFLTEGYIALAALVFLAVILLLSIEVKKQHPKHILHGIFVFTLIVCLLYFSQAILFPHLLLV